MISVKDNTFRIDYYCIIFTLVIFSNFGIGSFLLSDIIYLAVAVLAIVKTMRIRKPSKIYGYVVLFALFTLLSYLRFQHPRALLSCFRFVFGISICSILFSSYNNEKYRDKVISGYCNACVIFSSFLLLQFFSYYVLHFNIDFSFGDYAREENVAGGYNPLDSLFYRTGGLFKEPSWYAAYVVPSLFILTEIKDYKKLAICVCGLIASTSGLGFAVLAVYLVWLTLSFNRKLGVILMLVLAAAYYFLPFIFVKIGAGVVGEESSFFIRVQEPLEELQKVPFSIIGLDPKLHYDSSGKVMFFLNTFLFAYFYFGIIGLFFFIRYLYCNKILFLSIALLVIVMLEGLYGRIEFWMMLLACKLFNEELRLNSKRKVGVEPRITNIESYEKLH